MASNTPTTRRIGDVEVSAIGLGGMPMSIEGRPDKDRWVATIHAALEAGITSSTPLTRTTWTPTTSGTTRR